MIQIIVQTFMKIKLIHRSLHTRCEAYSHHLVNLVFSLTIRSYHGVEHSNSHLALCLETGSCANCTCLKNKEAIIQAELQGVTTKKLRNTKFEYLDQAML